MKQPQQSLKQAVYNFWNQEPCGTWSSKKDKESKAYFDEIEEYRYRTEPQIFSFAQFTRAHGKKVLEVGVGAGTDFIQWVRAGAEAHGVDLTPAAVQLVQKRLDVYGLKAAELKVADAEALPYPDAHFDIVYSWGVIHHSPDTMKCLDELIRVCKPGGTIKFMVYNRHCLYVYYRWLKYALGRARPWMSLSTVLHHCQESLGTKGYTRGEIKKALRAKPVIIKKVDAPYELNDHMSYRWGLVRLLAQGLATMLGRSHMGIYLMVELDKRGV